MLGVSYGAVYTHKSWYKLPHSCILELRFKFGLHSSETQQQKQSINQNMHQGGPHKPGIPERGVGVVFRFNVSLNRARERTE